MDGRAGPAAHLPTPALSWRSRSPAADPAQGVVFVGVRALLALALSRRAWYPLLLLASGPVVHAVNVGQWSPLVTAGSMLPGLGWLLACKPNIGLSLWLGSPDRATARRLALGVAAALAVSLLVLPGWPGLSFLEQPHLSLTPRPFGSVLLAAVRWRDPAARPAGTGADPAGGVVRGRSPGAAGGAHAGRGGGIERDLPRRLPRVAGSRLGGRLVRASRRPGLALRSRGALPPGAVDRSPTPVRTPREESP
jgi:hypothetical protein